jgi:hypothetical protein
MARIAMRNGARTLKQIVSGCAACCRCNAQVTDVTCSNGIVILASGATLMRPRIFETPKAIHVPAYQNEAVRGQVVR